jgi:hypothetical protein
MTGNLAISETTSQPLVHDQDLPCDIPYSDFNILYSLFCLTAKHAIKRSKFCSEGSPHQWTPSP